MIKRGKTLTGGYSAPLSAFGDEKPKPEYKLGECYENAITAMIHEVAPHERNDYRVVHGIVTGQGKIGGIRYGHAWIEFRLKFNGQPTGIIMAYDPAKNVTIPAEQYRRLGQATNIKSYTFEGMRQEMERTGHCGPWDEDIAKAAHTGTPTKKKKRRKNPLISGNKDYVYVKDSENWFYHYGDMGTGGDTVQWRMGAGRGTGHYGTGTYFVSEDRRQTPESMFYGRRPEYRVNVTGLKLVTFANSDSADRFHQRLKQLTEFVERRQYGEPWNEIKRFKGRSEAPAGKRLSRLYHQGSYGEKYYGLMEEAGVNERDYPERIGKPMRDIFDKRKFIETGLMMDFTSTIRNIYLDVRYNIGYKTPMEFEEVLNLAVKIADKHARFRRIRNRAASAKPNMITAGTELLIRLGFDGIDARNTTSDSFDRGSVLFPGWQTKVPPEAIQRMR